MCNQKLHICTFILLRKKNVVKRRTGCFQKVDNVRMSSIWRRKPLVSLDRFCLMRMLRGMSWLSFPPCHYRFWGGEEEETYVQPKVAHIAGSACNMRNRVLK